MTQALRLPAGLDVTRPSPARIYDCMPGGRRHFDADAQAAERIRAAVPEIRDFAWPNHGFTSGRQRGSRAKGQAVP